MDETGVWTSGFKQDDNLIKTLIKKQKTDIKRMPSQNLKFFRVFCNTHPEIVQTLVAQLKSTINEVFYLSIETVWVGNSCYFVGLRFLDIPKK